MIDDREFLNALVQQGLIQKNLSEEIERAISASGKDVVSILIDFQVITEEAQAWQALAEQLHADYQDLSIWEAPEAIHTLIPGALVRLHGALPISISEMGLHIALLNPLNPQTLEDLRFATGQEIQLIVADPKDINEKIEAHFGGAEQAMMEIMGQLSSSPGMGDDSNLNNQVESAPVIRFVDLVLQRAVELRASDIHFEPFETEFKLRYRVDGALYEMAPPAVELALPIISRVKVMANLNISERRVPQDGRIVKKIGDKTVEMRVSTLPTQHGESVVLRVLDRSAVSLDLTDLRLPVDIHEYIVETVKKPNGIFVVTGPTGAGKTTTLYAALQQINNEDCKILTAEDPVEYDMDGIVQIPVNEAIGLDFPRVLRAFLRQDPDKIMVGEMRDLDTAQIAIQAALTGHMVISTLHTNDAPGAVTRLFDMGVEPFLVAASVEGILAQRLVRTICADCKATYEPSEVILEQLGISSYEIGDKEFYTGTGCPVCDQSGYKGRKGLYELFDISEPIRDLINDSAPSVVLKQKAIELGMKTLREDGLANIYAGHTTVEEVLKYT